MKHKVNDPELREKISQFKQELLKAGFRPKTATTYVSEVNRYAETGNPMTEEAVREFFKAERSGRSYTYRAVVMKFVRFINGKPITRKPPRYLEKNKNDAKFIKECDHDCFNCKYEDCLLPA